MRDVFSQIERLSENDPLRRNVKASGKNSVTTGNQKISSVEDDTREDGDKRVVFHPSIVSPESGEDLSFDLTRVFTSNHRQEPSRMSGEGEERDERGILKSPKASEEDSSRPTNEVYTGMSRRCRKDLFRLDEEEPREGSPRKKGSTKFNFERKAAPPVSARATTYSAKGTSFLDELKVSIPSNGANKQPGNVTSRWLKEKQQKEDTPAVRAKNAISPRKFSVATINQARSGPPPKADDFFSELKQWHTAFALRDVEAPSEIRVKAPVTTTEEKKSEEKKEAIAIKETEKAAAEAKKALAKVEKEFAKKKKEEKVMMKKMEKESKKKKKFWKLPMLSKRKQKDEALIEPSKSEAEESPEAENFPEAASSTPMNEPVSGDHLTNLLKMIVEQQKPADESDEKPTPSGPTKDEALVETVVSEDSNICSEVGTQDSKLEPDGEELTFKLEPAEEEPVERESESEEKPSLETEIPLLFEELLETESWLDQVPFLKERFATVAATDELTALDLEDSSETDSGMDTTLEGSDLSTEKSKSAEEPLPTQVTETTTSEDLKENKEKYEDEEKPREVAAPEESSEGILGKLFGFGKKDERPMLVVEVDRYEMDKYEAIEATGTEENCSPEENYSQENLALSLNNVQSEDDQHLYSSFDNELRDEVNYFLQSQCACVGGRPVKTRRVKKVIVDNEPSWFELAADFFTPKKQEPTFNFDESVTVGSSVGGKTEKTEKAGNHGQKQTEDAPKTPEQEESFPSEANPAVEAQIIESPVKTAAFTPDDTFDVVDLDIVKAASTLTKEEIKMIESYEDNIMTLEDGTKVIKMAALMNLHQTESRTCDDSPRHQSKKKSDDRKSDDRKTKSSKKKKECGGATLFGNMSSPKSKNTKKKNKDSKKRGQTLF
mmetsp:Transcript_11846/g.24462  ORF Transcript_11846/g.24462 Transcript_11846/m.24462 type:complete len:894 (+) Transcript_11846:268-2949(+)|eukprot:CAMPEP_0197276920 /NCGR_PEP_ID=MMETSP1432-20130617/16202_1 /TAXON_ID=44447 /ORGANISM="Pseudo-nitzschia delicatissima, Strain UNC1205" /LENGTH=893 /DNA_ID=CAMNT_0042743047 /DNA_START=192 /DNA_END=2873 /DNA_ORIENTATION=+